MRSTITARGQTVVPAPIRERFGLGPSTRLEWIVDGGTARLLEDRAQDRQKDPEFRPLAQIPQEWLA